MYVHYHLGSYSHTIWNSKYSQSHVIGISGSKQLQFLKSPTRNESSIIILLSEILINRILIKDTWYRIA